jgi:hypothetical protein
VHVSNTTTVLRSDGSVWGQKPGSLPSALRGVGGQIVTGFTRLRAGLGRTATTVFACGTISGGAACWGDVTGFGGLGDGTSSASATPVAVRTAVSGPLLQAVTDLAVGNAAACAVSSGNVYCWGSNANGMLGANAAGDSMFAVQVVTATGPLGGVSQVSLGGSHGCAVTTTGKVYCWGSNSSGQLGRVGAGSPIAVEVTAIPSTATQVVAGVGGTAARMSDGTAWTWGAGSCQASGTLPALVMSGGTALTGVAEVLEDSFGTTYLRMTDGTSPVYSCASSAPLATIRDGANTPVTDFYRLTGPGSYADLCSVRQDGTLWVAHNTPLTEIEGPPCP